jgi:putative methionine-R-sulfoxide reductase with GAF domain
MPKVVRDYESIAACLKSSGSRESRLRAMVDALWIGLNETGVSWVGVYLDRPDEPDEQKLVLGPCRDKPACSPIGLHGVCGQAFRSRKSQIVRDVRELGANYVACDPRDRSEIVIPLMSGGSEATSEVCWGVLDLDSWEVGAFNERDERGLNDVLRAAGFQSTTAVPISSQALIQK